MFRVPPAQWDVVERCGGKRIAFRPSGGRQPFDMARALELCVPVFEYQTWCKQSSESPPTMRCWREASGGGVCNDCYKVSYEERDTAMADNAFVYKQDGDGVELNLAMITAGGVQFCRSPSMMVDGICNARECPCSFFVSERYGGVVIKAEESFEDAIKKVQSERREIEGGKRVFLQRNCGGRVITGCAQVTNGNMVAGSMLALLFNLLIEGGVDIRAVRRAAGAEERLSCQLRVAEEDEGYKSEMRM